jgi:hypothetical protein
MTNTDTAQPNAAQTQPTADQDRTAGITQDAPVGWTPEQQAKIDAIVANQKAEVRRRIQNEYGDLDELKAAKEKLDEKNAAELSEMEKLQKQIEDMKAEQVKLQQQAKDERLKTLRLRVGQEAGLPPVLAERLTGADEEAMKADAVQVLAALKADPRIPNIDATAGGSQTASKPRVKLTPGELAVAEQAVRSGLFKSVEEYADLKESGEIR